MSASLRPQRPRLIFAPLALALGALLLLSGCADDAESRTQQPQCAQGQVLNPLTGACVSDGAAPTPDTGGEEGDVGSVPDTGVDLAPDSGAPAPDGGTRAPDTNPPPPPPEELVRFVAVGDTGTGSATQVAVGQAMGTVCEGLGGCDFGLLLGDNVYDTGVASVDDMLFETTFAIPYGHLPFAFYAVLGNHDLGGGGVGLDPDFRKGDYQVGYSDLNPQWIMPAKFYQVTIGPVFLVGLNTTAIFFEQENAQEEAIAGWLPQAGDRWKIAFGHHPYISNGKHGNAGEYEGLPFVPIVNGKNVKDFVEDNICGDFHLYLAGHDHSRQDLQARCGTEFFISGAGAKTTEIKGDNPSHWEADTAGFAVIEAATSTLTLRFYDQSGVLEHSRTITR